MPLRRNILSCFSSLKHQFSVIGRFIVCAHRKKNIFAFLTIHVTPPFMKSSLRMNFSTQITSTMNTVCTTSKNVGYSLMLALASIFFGANMVSAQTPTINCPGNITTNNTTNVCGAVVTWSAPTATACSGSTQTVNFNYTGGVQTWTVPSGVTSVTIQAWGGQGKTSASAGIVGGRGGYATGNRAVTAGQLLRIYVGGGGGVSVGGGFNGGGNAGLNNGCGGARGGGGGGASDVRIGGAGLGNRIIVAGGGGGAGGRRIGGCGRGSGGGGGGGYYGGGGGAGWPGIPPGGPVPTGGTQSAGGSGGVTTWTAGGPTNGGAGGLGFGGVGGNEVGSNQAGTASPTSGGWGGGTNGQNGSWNAINNWTGQSGAGGSGYIGGVTGGSMLNNQRTGNGLVSITYSSGGPATITQTGGLPSGSTFPVGTTTNTFQAACGSSTSTCSFTVTVNDTQAPTINGCPSNMTLSNTTNQCSRVVSWTVPTVSDNCSGATIAQTAGPGPGSTFPVGSTTIAYLATDASGNTATCQFTITINDTQNPSITCPSNLTVGTNSGSCVASGFSLGTPSTSDNCAIASGGNNAPSTFPLGNTSVVWTVTDAAGNFSTCVQTVTVVDDEDPTITCPGTVTVNANSGSCFATGVSLGSPTAADNCGSPTVSNDAPSSFPIGSTTVTWTAIDAAGNTATCTQTVIVNDNENPTISCPSNVTVGADGGQCTASGVSLGTPSTSDNCPGETVSNNAPSVFPLGNTTVVWTVTDAAGNTATCNQTVTVTDTQDPTISCPANVTVNVDAGSCAATGVSLGSPVTNDNCPGEVATNNAPSSFPVGTTTVVWTVTDGAGNTATCNQTVTVIDNIDPTISCPSNVTVNVDAGQCTATGVSLGTPSTSDNCPGETVNNNAPASYPVGNTTVTWTVTDASGNTATCNQTVTVVDNINPSIACPANITVSADAGQCSKNVSFSDPTFSDNCPGATLNQTVGLPSGGLFSVGTHTITYVVTDASGNTATCSFTITVEDNEAPIFNSCPVDVTLSTDAGVCTAVYTYNVGSVSDNCDGSVTPVLSAGLASGSAFPIGATVVTYTATDAAGNVGTCSFTVTVEDDEAPQMNCPSDQTVTFDSNCQYEILDYVSQVSFLQDNCDSSPTVSQSPVAGTVITGSTEITMTAVDASGNSISCTFFINPNDIVAPTIACPGTQQVPVNSICQFTLPDYTGAVVSDDCDPNPVVTQSPAVGSILTATTTVTLTVTDASGNSSNCSFTVNPLDNTPPVVSCPGNQLENFSSACNFVLPDYTGLASATDNCDNSVLLTQFPPAGTTINGSQTITITGTDDAGNTATCTFSVIPDDNTPPTISCAGNLNVDFNAQCQFIIPDYTGTATVNDNCDSNPVVTQSPVAGSSIGTTTTVTLTATDADGNAATCTFDVIPSDNTAPSINCPGNQTVSVNASCSSTLADYTGQASVNDNCDASPTVTQSPSAGTTVSGAGTVVTVTLTATDADGNSSSCTFTVTNEDDTDPVISCPGDQSVSFDSNCQHTVSDYTSSATVTDNCDASPTVTQTPSAGSTITGLTEITLTATDASGNISSCSFDLIPDDTEDPTIACPGDQNVSFTAGCDYALIDYTGMATTSDNCDNSVTVTQSPAFGTVITTTQTVTLTATDDAGNTATCTFDVIPSDNTDPTITCPGNQSENFTAGCDFVLPDYTGLATTADNCDASPTVTQSPAIGSTITGSTTITLTATDAAGNSASCTFSVLPIDNTPPSITCGGNLNVSFNAVCQFNIPDYTGTVTVNDNCDANPVVTQSPVVGTSIGTTTTVTITATDASGNSASCTFDVIPADDTAPSISCPGDQNASFDASCQYDLLDYTGFATVNDNCDPSPTVTQSPSAGTTITGSQTVTLTATDASGNTSTCTFDVIPADDTDPTITCPSDQNVNFDSNCQYTLLDYTGLATVSDDCDASPTVTQSPASGTVVSGDTEVTLTATDASGNIATCTFDVLPTDNSAPILTCPADQIVGSDPSCQFYIVDYTASATVTDNCDNDVTVTQSPAVGTSITVATTVTLTATDDEGNTTSCSFLVTPSPDFNPVISCPGDQQEDFNGDCEFDLIDYTSMATATDNCDVAPTVTQSPAPGTTINTQTTVTLTATDADNNTATCTFEVIPSDNTPPTVTCPGDMNVSYANQCQFVMVDYTGLATVSDNCDANPTVTQSPSVGTLIAGPTVVTLSATDADGNIGSCTFTITPTDLTAPVVTCPGDQTEDFDANCQFTLPSYTTLASVYDNCDVPPFSITQSPAAGTLISGQTTITLSVTDAAGNTGSCTFDVIPNDAIDPTITCPGNQTPSFDANCQYTLLDYTGLATAADNCDPSPVVTQSPAAGTVISVNTTVTLTVTDASGNSSTCTFSVIPQDVTPPSVSCPPAQEVSFNANCEFTLPDYTGLATISDNCDATPFITQSPGIGTTISGTTTVTITATDDAGNSASCTVSVIPYDDIDPTISCPGDQLEDFTASCQFVLPDYTGLATAADNCDANPAVTQSPAAGTTISGLTEITLTATDANGNNASCTFDVVPNDNTPPAVSCPADMAVSYNSQCQFSIPDYTGLAVVTDNCDPNPVVTQNPTVGTVISGPTVITLYATDADGNVGSCTFTITPSDNTAPVVSCPGDQTESFDANCQFTLPSYTTLASVFDNCDAPPFTITQSPAAGAVISGATTITLSVTDASGNTGTCTFEVLPEDDIDPTIVCPGNQTPDFDAGCDYTLLDYTSLATVADNCDANPVVTQAPAAGTVVSTNTAVTLTVTDAAGNSASCTFNVIPADNTPPSVVCPADQTVNFNANCEFALPDYSGLAVITDNCDFTPYVVQSPSVGTIVSGTTTVTITATDDDGNSASCTFDVIPVDNTPPTITCPGDQSEDLSANCDFTIPDYTGLATATDACDPSVDVTQSPAPGAVVSSNTTVTLTATDDNGNSSTCSFTVIVEDNTDPVIVCPGDQTVDLSANCLYVLQDYTGSVTVTDNCDNNPTVTQSPLTGTLIGSATVITLTATDADGNSSTCSFTVTPEDNDPPTIFDCPTDVTVFNDFGDCGAVVTWGTITATDNCAGVIVPQQVAGLPSGSSFPVGTTTVNFEADDGNGNVSNCIFVVTVIDNEVPTITCQADITQVVDAGTCGAVVTYSLPSVSDNCTNGIVPTLESGLASGSTFPEGTTVVTYEAEDAAGNTNTCSFTVTVVDNEPPVITCPADVTVNVDPNTCGSVVTYNLPTVTDNCNQSIVPALSAGFASGGTFPLGTTTVTYQANDGNGNTASCSFTVTVVDNEPPTITCPADITVNVDPNTCGAVVTYNDPTVVDNCATGITPVLQAGFASGVVFPEGTTTVTYSADDGNGNSATCSFTVTVVDNEPPTITCPGDQLEAFNANCTLTLPDYTGLGAAVDNCDGSPVITQSPAAGAVVTGVTTVTLTATDVDGNASSCTFDVIDNTPPVITCLADQTVGTNINCEYELLDYTAVTIVTENCGSATVSQDPPAGTIITSQTTVTMTAVDDYGNTSSCDFDIILEDNIAPSITCLGDQSVFFDPNCSFELPDYTVQAFAEDNCDVDPTVTQSPAPGTVVFGSSVVTLTAEDDAGNTTSCTFSVDPIDNTAPVITCPGSQVADLDANCEFLLDDYTALAQATDNCGSVDVVQVPVPGTLLSTNTVVTITATDLQGNSNSCTFLVVPEDNIDPVITCIGSLDVDFNQDCEYALVDYSSILTVTDNCSNAFIFSQSPGVGTIITSTTAVTVTATDAAGNSTDCTFDVIPADNTPPTIQCADDQLVPLDANCEAEVGDYSGLLVASDNCSNNITVTQSPVAGTSITTPTTVTLSADDGNGNVATCTLEVTPIDVTPPTISCPNSQVVSFDANCEFVLPDYGSNAAVSDNCSGTITVVQSLEGQGGGTGGSGPGTIITQTETVVLTATDESGNSWACSFDVIPVDDTPPTVVCPPDQDVAFDANCEYALLDYTGLAQAEDNCGLASVTQSPAVGTVISGATQVTITAEDAEGNTESCSFFVNPVDDEDPTITCVGNQSVSFDANCEFELVDYTTQATTTDNCASVVTVTQDPAPGTVFSASAVVTLTADDGNGNSVTCTFAVVPTDNVAPVITNCPPDQPLSLDANCDAVVPDYTVFAAATDNCDTEVEITQVPAAGSTISGSTPEVITITATDDAGNTTSCTFTVTPVDNVDPTIICPGDQDLQLSANCVFEMPDYTSLAQASDACSAVTLTQSPVPGTLITGTVNATIIVEDASGNTAFCTFFVTPIEMVATATGTDVTCQGGNDGAASVVTTGGTPPYSADWGGEDPSQLSAGTYTVVVSDANGCQTSATVTIEDGDPFQIQISANGSFDICDGQSLVLDAGAGYAVYDWSTGATVQTITVFNAGTYWVQVANGTGCWSNIDTVTVNVLDPVTPEIIETPDGLLTCSNDTALSYQWFLNGNQIPGATNVNYCPTISGNYYVQIIDSYGCTVDSYLSEYTFNDSSPCATGIEEYGLSMNIFPNPSTGEFVVKYELSNESKLDLAVFDMLGKQVTSSIRINSMSGTQVIDLSSQADGVYMLRVGINDKRVVQERLILVK